MLKGVNMALFKIKDNKLEETKITSLEEMMKIMKKMKKS